MIILPYFPSCLEVAPSTPCPLTGKTIATIVELNSEANFPTLVAVIEDRKTMYLVSGGRTLLDRMISSQSFLNPINQKTARKVIFFVKGAQQKFFHQEAACKTISEMNAFAMQFATMLPKGAQVRFLHDLGFHVQKNSENGPLALEFYKEVLRYHPRAKRTLLNLGITLSQGLDGVAKDVKGAIDYFSRALPLYQGGRKALKIQAALDLLKDK